MGIGTVGGPGDVIQMVPPSVTQGGGPSGPPPGSATAGAAALGGGGSNGATLQDAVRQLSSAVEALSKAIGRGGVAGGGPAQVAGAKGPGQVGGADGCGCAGGGGAKGSPEQKGPEPKGAKGAPEAKPKDGAKPSEYQGTGPKGASASPQKLQGETSHANLTEQSRRVLSAAHDAGLKLISGHRPGDSGSGHSNGSAVDVANVPGGSRPGSPEMKQFAEAMRAAGKAGDPTIGYVIYEQKIASAKDNWEWRPMEDRGSNTQNHFDHVHVSTDPKL